MFQLEFFFGGCWCCLWSVPLLRDFAAANRGVKTVCVCAVVHACKRMQARMRVGVGMCAQE